MGGKIRSPEALERRKARNREYMKTYVPDPLKRKMAVDKYNQKANVVWRRQGWHLWDKYKLTPAQWTALLDAQNFSCAICSRPWTREDKPLDWHVDHDHGCCDGPRSCGECVRGILCQACNKGLGHFMDNPQLLRFAAEYLSR